MNSRRSEITAAAKELLRGEGSAGFSLRKVADFLGMSLGNLQYYFPTRVHLLESILEEDITDYRRGFEAFVSSPAENGFDLHQILTAFLVQAGKAEEIAVFRALFSFNDQEILEKLNLYYQELYTLLEEILAQISGRPAGSREVQEAACVLFPFLDGYELTKTYLPLEPAALAAVLAGAVERILSGRKS